MPGRALIRGAYSSSRLIGAALSMSAFAPNRTLGVAHRPTYLVRVAAKVGRELTIIPEALLREDPWQKGLDPPLDEMVLDLLDWRRAKRDCIRVPVP